MYLLLSDGMGSGEAAHREAAMTVRLLRQFLEAGIEPGPALKTLNTALSLRGESGGGFTTIDLLALQRSSGQAALYKYGAAPSYCKRGGSVSRYAGQSLPAGLQAVRDAPECTRLQLTAGSFSSWCPTALPTRETTNGCKICWQAGAAGTSTLWCR